jgi:hypothetical protein
MRIIRLTFVALCVFLSAAPLFSQDSGITREDIWITSVGEARIYSLLDPAPVFGIGVAVGYGDGVSFGFKGIYFWDISDKFSVLELSLLVRFYPLNMTGHSGMFIQINGGQLIVFQNDKQVVPSELGTISVGLGVGWRLVIGSNFYLEPAVSVGYPYFLTAGLSVGVRF